MKNSRINAGHSVVVLVDYQERLMPAIHQSQQVIGRAGLLAETAHQLGVPVIGTAQNPSKLGAVVGGIRDYCQVVVDKASFGACEDGLLPLLPAGAEVIVAGCEAHVCLMQTALGLLEADFPVWVVADACGSRRTSDQDLAFERLRAAGAHVVSVEMVVFEWLRTFEHPRFRAISALVKATP